jgi:hypothetical protein
VCSRCHAKLTVNVHYTTLADPRRMEPRAAMTGIQLGSEITSAALMTALLLVTPLHHTMDYVRYFVLFMWWYTASVFSVAYVPNYCLTIDVIHHRCYSWLRPVICSVELADRGGSNLACALEVTIGQCKLLHIDGASFSPSSHRGTVCE